jgi:hypothetical protein
LQNNQGSTAANYWANYLPPIIGRDEDVRQLYDLICSSERRPTNDTHVVTVLGPPNIGKDAVDVVSKVCSQLVLSSSNWLTPPFELCAIWYLVIGWWPVVDADLLGEKNIVD